MTTQTQLSNRLDKLPPKVATPFRQLLATGQLDDNALSIILDAGDLANDQTRLLGFAVGYLHLRAQRIPVHDVIDMAKNQKRRINLAWSAKRWKHEHERLSRAEALDRLAKENFHYDVSKFEAHFPKNIPGYLIRTSRRLGIEGLRQRHCVASYHNQLRAGSTAIATIIADRKRWTVQLFLTEDSEAPLRIAQIKTRFNELPPAKTRDHIYNMLGLDPNRPIQALGGEPRQRRTYMDTLRTLLPVLSRHNVEHVAISFDGYGDSGSIQDIYFTPNGAFDPDTITVEHQVTRSYFEDGNWITTCEVAPTPVKEVIEELTYDYLGETGVDWYNGDGGYGELQIDVEHQTVNLEVHVRYTETTTEFSSERSITTGEEI